MKVNTENMLIELITAIQTSSAYYADLPEVFDLLQGDERFKQFREKNGLLEQFEVKESD
jgi:hypothetical protein